MDDIELPRDAAALSAAGDDRTAAGGDNQTDATGADQTTASGEDRTAASDEDRTAAAAATEVIRDFFSWYSVEEAGGELLDLLFAAISSEEATNWSPAERAKFVFLYRQLLKLIAAVYRGSIEYTGSLTGVRSVAGAGPAVHTEDLAGPG